LRFGRNATHASARIIDVSVNGAAFFHTDVPFFMASRLPVIAGVVGEEKIFRSRFQDWFFSAAGAAIVSSLGERPHD
jgi:hypothetical protein